MPMISTALQAGTILLREGLEALLIITALAVFLKRTGSEQHGAALAWGAGSAILASLGAAILFELYLGGGHDDRLEALIMVIAAGLMLYMSGWLFLKQNPRAWQADVQAAAQRALGRGTVLSLAGIAFLAVFREGAETILFLHALARTGAGWDAGMALGLASASLLLVLIFVAIRTYAVKLPLRALFLTTSAFLFVMALRFIGGAISEMQEMQLLSFTPLDGPAWSTHYLGDLTQEGLIAQGVIALLAMLCTGLGYWRKADGLAPERGGAERVAM